MNSFKKALKLQFSADKHYFKNFTKSVPKESCDYLLCESMCEAHRRKNQYGKVFSSKNASLMKIRQGM